MVQSLGTRAGKNSQPFCNRAAYVGQGRGEQLKLASFFEWNKI